MHLKACFLHRLIILVSKTLSSGLYSQVPRSTEPKLQLCYYMLNQPLSQRAPQMKKLLRSKCQKAPQMKKFPWIKCHRAPQIKTFLWNECQRAPHVRKLLWNACQKTPPLRACSLKMKGTVTGSVLTMSMQRQHQCSDRRDNCYLL